MSSPVGLDAVPALGRPSLNRLHQVAVGAAYVEERAVPLDGVTYQAPRIGPLTLVAASPRLTPRRIRGEIGRRYDLADLAVPLCFVDLSGLQRRLRALDQRVSPVLYGLDRLLFSIVQHG